MSAAFLIVPILGYLGLAFLIIWKHRSRKRQVQELVARIKARGGIQITSNADGTFRVEKIKGTVI